MRAEKDGLALKPVQTLNHDDLSKSATSQLDLQGQLKKAEERIQVYQSKRNDLIKTCSEEKIKLQQLTNEVEILTEQINGSVMEQHLDAIRYIDAELSQLRSFQNIVDDLLHNKCSQLNAIHSELQDRRARTSLEMEQLLKDTSDLKLEDSSDSFFKKLSFVEDSVTLDGSERAVLIGDGLIQDKCIRQSAARAQRRENIRQLNRNRLKIAENLQGIQIHKIQQDFSNKEPIEAERSSQEGLNHFGNADRRIYRDDKFGTIHAKIAEHRLRLSEDIRLLNNLQRKSKLKRELSVMSQSVFLEIRQLFQERILPSIIEKVFQASISISEIEQKESLLIQQQKVYFEREKADFMQSAVSEIWQEFCDNTVREFVEVTAKEAMKDCLLIYEAWKAQSLIVSQAPVTNNMSSFIDELIRNRPSDRRIKLHQLKVEKREALQKRDHENFFLRTWKNFSKTSAPANTAKAKTDL